MLLEDAIKIAKIYYLDKEIPNTTREWRSNCPPELTAGKINSMNFTVGDVLRGINPKARKRSSNAINYDLKALGFKSLTFTKDTGEYVCSNCGNTYVSSRSSILKWLNTGIKYCSSCRGSSGLSKTVEYYTKLLPEEYEAIQILPGAGNTKIEVLHKACNTKRIYSSRHVLSSDYLVCNHCEGLEGYDSKQEKLLCEHILNAYKDLEVEFQVPYKELSHTTRRWVLDVYFPELKLALEITTKYNNYENYFENLNNKLEFLNNAGYRAYVVYSVAEVDDIVRSLLKNKEG